MNARGLATLVLGAVLTLGLVAGGDWLWDFAQAQIKGTPFSSFKFFPSVLAIFVALSLAEWLFNRIEGLIRRTNSSED